MNRRKLKKEISGGWLDKTINAIAPQWAAKRMAARARIAFAAHGFSAADKSRGAIEGWNFSSGDADEDILSDLPTLREESRDLHRNSGLVNSIFGTKVTSVVGSGLVPHPQIDFKALGLPEDGVEDIQDGIKREWDLFAKKCNIDGELNFGQTCALAYLSLLENGDVFALTPFDDTPGTPYSRKIQLIEADRISNPDEQVDSDVMSGGIELHPRTGRRLACHVRSIHPGSLNYDKDLKWAREAFFTDDGLPRVLHLTKKKRIGQRRGVPELAPVIELIKQLTRYTESEVAAAVITSFFTVFTKGTQDVGGLDPLVHEGGNSGENTDRKFKMGYGNMFDLAPGEEVEFADPNRPNKSFNDFAMALITQICAALQIPAEIALKSFTKSYTASRAAMAEAWKLYLNDRLLLVDKICNPMYELFFTEAVSLGRISAPGFLDGDAAIRQAWLKARWVGPPRGMIDEVKEIEAAERRTEGGFTTLEYEVETLFGGDWEPAQRQRSREVGLRRELGLQIPLEQISEFRR